MQNITRTLTDYKLEAYGIGEDENGAPTVQVVAECNAESASMTKPLARAELVAATGQPIPRGTTIKWKALGTITYAMPLDKFLDGAIIIKRENIADEVPTANVQ